MSKRDGWDGQGEFFASMDCFPGEVNMKTMIISWEHRWCGEDVPNIFHLNIFEDGPVQ